jgi:hypothetical protein
VERESKGGVGAFVGGVGTLRGDAEVGVAAAAAGEGTFATSAAGTSALSAAGTSASSTSMASEAISEALMADPGASVVGACKVKPNFK